MDDKDLPIDKRNGKPHVGTKNLKSFKPGESGNPKGRPVGSLGKKNRFKKDLLVLKWMAEDPELAELVASMDNVEMFDTLKSLDSKYKKYNTWDEFVKGVKRG